jgi:hypothetical protein
MATQNTTVVSVPVVVSRIRLRTLASFPVLLGVILVAGVFATTLARGTSGAIALQEPDTWWHIAVGEQILKTHHFPLADKYSFTATGQKWIASEWLGEIAIAEANRSAGFVGVVSLLFVFSAAVMVLLYYLAYLRSGSWQAAFLVCAVFLALGLFFFTARPQLMGYTLLLIELICLERFRLGKQRQLWALPFLFLVWVNLHGSFVLGLLSLAVYAIGGLVLIRAGGIRSTLWTADQRRHLAWIAPLCLAALFVTPYGSQLAFYPFRVAFTQPMNIANIAEWQPMRFDLPIGKEVLLVLLIFLIALFCLQPVFRLDEVALFLPALYGSMVHRRMAFFLMIVFVPILAKMAARFLPSYRPEIDKYLLNFALVAAMLFGAAHFATNNQLLSQKLSEHFPVRAVDFLRRHRVDAPMYNEYGWGGYLIWAFPEKKVFVDGRTDLYEYPGVFGDYLAISRLDPQAFNLLRKYGVGMCLLERNGPLGTALRAMPDWRLAYEDDLSAVFVREAPSLVTPPHPRSRHE